MNGAYDALLVVQGDRDTMDWTPPASGTVDTSRDPRFQMDKFLLNQKKFSLGKYWIHDDMDRKLFYVTRPVMKVKANIGFYEDESATRKILDLEQDHGFFAFNQAFVLKDTNGVIIGKYERPWWPSVLRRTWKIFDANGQHIAMAHEDSWPKALMRRIPYLDEIGRFMRTNFIIVSPQGKPIGEFIRKLTLHDKYAMDLTQDLARTFDRRIAVGLAVLLDSAEGR
jgi:uncharacterized protein YxjI